MDVHENPSFFDVLLAIVSALCLTAICLLAMYMKLDGATIPLVSMAIIFTIIGWGYGKNACIKDYLIRLPEEKKGCAQSTIRRNYD